MKPTFTRRYRRRSTSARSEGAFFKKESQPEQSFFGGASHDTFFQPAMAPVQSIQRKCENCEEESKVHRMEDKKEEKVMKKEDKKEEEKVMRAEDKKEEKKVQRAEDKKEEEKVMKMEDKKEEEKVQKKEAGAPAASGKTVSNYIGSLNSKGQSLPAQSNQFFSSKMGYDFSGVKVHTDKEAAESAKAINAKAYTIGNNVVFNEGQYNTESAEGRKLMAHELMHVVQQDSENISREVIRRSKITHRQITWADFSGTPPAVLTNEGAGINSGFDIPGYGVSPDTKKLKGKGSKCKIGKRKESYYESKVVLDPKIFDQVVAYMDQGQSWAINRYKQTPVAYCTTQVPVCEQKFDSMVSDVARQCNQLVLECEDAFNNKHWRSFGVRIGSTDINARNVRECRSHLYPECNRLTLAGSSIQVGNIPVTSKAQCNSTVKRDCIVHEPAENARLLKHEQGHFDITKVITDKARTSIQDKITATPIVVKECGEQAATDAALALYHSLDAEITSLIAQWRLLKNTTQDEYDAQTVHGTDSGAQTRWEGSIAAGLPQVKI